MTSYGYTLLGEEHGPQELVALGSRAEEVGFEFVVASDHFHPWVPEQRHAPYAWAVLGAVAATTERIQLATMVTCPTFRYHPAVVAQKAATLGVLSGGRFTLGLGAGERLNEHVVGAAWPSVDERHERLAEAIDVIRLLFRGGYQRYRGHHVRLDDARLFDLPEQPVPIAVAASGPRSAALAGRGADALIAIDALPGIVEAFDAAGGAGKPRWCQVPVCWAPDEDSARRTAHDRFRWAPLGWKVLSELPNPVSFDWATKAVTPDDVAQQVAVGPDPERHLAAIRPFLELGYTHVALCQVGPDQEGFLRFWQEELAPRLVEEPVGSRG